MRKTIFCGVATWCFLLSAIAAAASAVAPGAARERSYILAVVPYQLPLTVHKEWSPLAERLAQRLGARVELKLYRAIPHFEEDLARGEPDLAFMNPYHLIMTRKTQGYIPLVRSGQALSGILVVRRDSPIKTVAALKQSGNFNQESLSGLADSFSRSVTAQPLLDKYSLNDAKTVSMSDQSVSKYYDDFFEKISIYVSTKRGSELEIIAAALGLSSTERIKELDPIIKSYDDLAKELISISVPSDAVSAHLSAVNDLVKIALSLENAKSVAENPIRGVMGIAQYQKYNADLEFDFERINQYFENSGIISQTEQ